MFFKKKKITKYWVGKFYSFSCNEVEVKNLTENLLNSFIKEGLMKPSSFEINYNGTVHDFNKFIRRLRDSINLEYISILSSEDQVGLVINFYNEPKFIEFQVTLHKDLEHNSNVRKYIIDNGDLNFDYGYALFLDDTYDVITEKKIKKRFLSNSIDVSSQDLKVIKAFRDVNKGKIKDIYPINFLNSIHLESKELDDLISSSVTEANSFISNIKEIVLSEESVSQLKNEISNNVFLSP